MDGVGDPLREITPSDDHGHQAFVIAEAVTLSLASSLTIPVSLSPNGGNGPVAISRDLLDKTMNNGLQAVALVLPDTGVRQDIRTME